MRRDTHERSMRTRRWFIGTVACVVVLTLVMLCDPWLARALRADDVARLNGRDWYRAARVIGSLWLWLPVVAVLALHDRGWRRADAVFWSVVLAGVIAELFKRVVPRSRPFDAEGVLMSPWRWRLPMSGFWDGHGLGFPSSHTAVAFAGCLALALFMPRARWALVLAATACGFSRMLAGAHFASDVLVGALIGWLAACAVAPDRSDATPARVAR